MITIACLADVLLCSGFFAVAHCGGLISQKQISDTIVTEWIKVPHFACMLNVMLKKIMGMSLLKMAATTTISCGIRHQSKSDLLVHS